MRTNKRTRTCIRSVGQFTAAFLESIPDSRLEKPYHCRVGPHYLKPLLKATGLRVTPLFILGSPIASFATLSDHVCTQGNILQPHVLNSCFSVNSTQALPHIQHAYITSTALPECCQEAHPAHQLSLCLCQSQTSQVKWPWKCPQQLCSRIPEPEVLRSTAVDTQQLMHRAWEWVGRVCFLVAFPGMPQRQGNHAYSMARSQNSLLWN